MPESTTTKRYYPKLSEIITVSDLPEFLSFVQGGLNAIFENIHYKNLQFSKSFNGDAAFYSLDIVSRQAIKFALPGDLALVLNPDLDGNSSISSFPVTLEYQWEILAFLKSFSLEDFSFTLEDFYLTGLKVFRISEVQVLAHTLNNFVVQDDPNISKYQQVVDDINIYYNLTGSNKLALPVGVTPSLEVLVAAIKQHPGIDSNVSLLLFLIYVNDTESNAVTKQRLQEFYTSIVPEGIEAYLKRIIIPKAKATLSLSAAVEFPTNILNPTLANGTPIPDQKTKFIFAQAELYVDTEKGVGYNLELAGSLFPDYAQIANTGLLLQIDSLKLDLSKNENIIEADLDGRPNDFIGVYARALSITFPPKWFKNITQPASSTTLRLGGYDLLVGTGGLSGTIMLESVPVQASGGTFEYYNNKFAFLYPITMFEKDATTQTIKEKTISNYTQLKAFLVSLNTSGAPYPFKFPLSLLPNSSSVPKVFNNFKDYQVYLASLNDNYLWKQIGTGSSGFRIGFNKFDMTFKQNAVVSSNIQALLEINRFKYPQGHVKAGQIIQIGVNGHIQEDGDFNLTASVEGGIKASLGKFVDFNFLTLELGREDDTFYVGTSVELSFPNGLMSTLTEGKKIVLPKVRIYSDGSFEIVGGNGFLPVNFSLPLGPVDLAVTGIHIGSIQRNYNGEQRKYNYIGFDGAISVNPFGIDARGEGIKYYYTVDDDSFGGIGDAYLHIQTIYIDMVVPYNAPEVAIKGMLSIPEPGVSQEYQGSVSFQSKKTNVSGNASMRLIPKYPAFLVDASVDLPKPIPLGSVSIYGFRGLIGHRYVAEKKAVKTVTLTESSTWYDYYKAPQKGINIAKFSSPEQTSGYSNPFSFGLGVVIGTSFDNGNVLSVRAMMLLSLPSLYMIEGRASILSSKTGLADSSEPPFFANLTYSSTSIEMGIGADYKLPRNNGQILELYAEAQAAFFQNNPSNWYVNIGTKEKPNQATLFKDLINLKPMSYLMLSAKGVEAGARIDYELKKSFFGIKVHLYAYVEVGAKISFERPQLGGYLSLGGGIDVNVWRMIRINFELNAILSAEAVEPYLLFAELKFRGSIKLGFFRIRFKVKLKLKWEENSTINKNAIPPLPYLDTTNANGTFPRRVLELVKGTHMLTNESFPIDYLGVDLNTIDVREIKTYIPLDTYIDIKTVKGLDPSLVSPKIGGHTSGATEYLDLIPPEKTVKGGVALRQVKHRYSIERIEIKALVGTQWVDYHPYEAVVEAADRDLVKNFKIGYWQRSGNQYNAIRLLANNPLSYLDAGEPGWIIPEQYGVTPSNLFCHTEINKWHTSNVLNKVLGTIYQLPLQFQAHYINGAYFTLIDEYDTLIPITDSIAVNTMQVTSVANVHNFAQSLSISNYNKLVIVLPQDAVVVKLKLSSKSENVKITCYRTISDSASITVQYEEVASIVKTALALNSELVYPNSFGISAPYLPIMKIIIEPIVPVNDAIIAIQEQIEALFTETYEGLNGVSNVMFPNDLDAYLLLNAKLQELWSNSCFPEIDYCADYNSALCGLYTLLSDMECFGEVTNVSGLSDNCYLEFTSYLNDFESLNPEYGPVFAAYIAAHKNFVAIRRDEDATNQQVIDLYNIMWKEAERLLSLLLILGNCNCSNISTSNCTTSLQQVQWKTVVDFDFETTIPGADAVNEDRLLMQEAVARNPQPVWRPNTTYHIKFSLKDNVDDGSNNSKTFNYYYGFKTSGPVGYYHNTPGVRYGNEYSITNQLLNRKDIYGNIDPNGELTNPDQYTLTSLRSYIDYNRSYPNADGNLILAKPLYYSNKECRISVFFTKSYAYNLMNSWPEYKDMQELKGTLNIMIKDPVSDLLIPYPLPENYDESVPQPNPGSETGTIWESDTSPQLPIGAITLNHYLMNGNIECEIEPGAILAPASFNYSVILTNLKASKLYTAILNNAFDKNNSGTIDSNYSENQEVHRFVFQTSRYGTFQEHVQSYLLTDGFETRKAIFKISSTVSPMEIQTAFEIVSGQNITVGDADNYIDLYDRVIENVFRLKPFEAPLTTEFNLLFNSEDDSIIAIIIRSPEPFNNPRMPKAVINDTIKVVGENDEELSDYPILHSKDCSQAIIMYDGVIGVSSLRIMFDYLAWNGNEFERPADVSKEYVDINL